MEMTSPLELSKKGDNVIIYGGGFDPVTIAHDRMAWVAGEQCEMFVWMMPCYGHRFGKELADPVHRLKMVELLAKENPYIIPFDHEIQKQHNGSMYETLVELSSRYPSKQFHLLIGMDNANCIHEWDRGQELILKFPCIVCGRKGYPSITQWYAHPPHTYIPLDMSVSATDVRNAIENGDYERAKSNVRASVWGYIVDNAIYGYREKQP